MAKVLGLTGCIGMGKSTVSQMFRDNGVSVFCSDTATHELRGPHGAALPIIEQFVPGSTDPETGTDMAKVRAFVFADRDNLEALTLAMLPLVRDEMLRFKNGFFFKPDPLIVLDVPLLFELNLDGYCDAIAVVSAGGAEQRRRVMARGKMNEIEFEKIKAAQMSDVEKRKRANFIIDTNCALDHTRKQVEDIIERFA